MQRSRMICAAVLPVMLPVMLAMLLSSCISVDRNTRSRSISNVGGDEIFREIVPGQTTRTWLIEHLGKPDAVWIDAKEHEVLRYDNVREHRTEVSVFPLIDVDVSSEDVERYFFELADSKLVRYWRETNDAVQPQ